MPKVSFDSMTLADWDRLAHALPLMLKACQELDELEDYTPDGEYIHHNAHVDRAQVCARRALKKLEGK